MTSPDPSTRGSSESASSDAYGAAGDHNAYASPAGGQQFGSPTYGGAHPSGGASPHLAAEVERTKRSALIALIVGFLCGGLLPGVLGLLGYLKADTEPETARKFTKWSWIVFAIIWGLSILGVIAYVIFVAVIVGVGSSTGS